MFVFVFVCVGGTDAIMRPESGVFSESFITIVQPIARAGPSFQACSHNPPIAYVRAIQHAAHTNGTTDAIFWCSAMQHTQPANMQMGSRFERLPA